MSDDVSYDLEPPYDLKMGEVGYFTYNKYPFYHQL